MTTTKIMGLMAFFLYLIHLIKSDQEPKPRNEGKLDSKLLFKNMLNSIFIPMMTMNQIMNPSRNHTRNHKWRQRKNQNIHRALGNNLDSKNQNDIPKEVTKGKETSKSEQQKVEIRKLQDKTVILISGTIEPDENIPYEEYFPYPVYFINPEYSYNYDISYFAFTYHLKFESGSSVTEESLSEEFYEFNEAGTYEFKLETSASELDFSELFELTNFKRIKFESINGKIIGMFGMFAYNEEVESIDLGSDFNTIDVNSMSGAFFGLPSLNELNLGDKFDTSNVEDMCEMFAGCSSIMSLDLGNNFNTENVTNMGGMFSDMWNLTSLDLGDKFNTSNVEDMSYMFSQCKSLENLNFGPKFNTQNVFDISGMFFNMTKLRSLDLRGIFDTSNVEYMCETFAYTLGLQTLELGDHFYVDNVHCMDEMFKGCMVPYLHFDNVWNINYDYCSSYGMFDMCLQLQILDLSNFQGGYLDPGIMPDNGFSLLLTEIIPPKNKTSDFSFQFHDEFDMIYSTFPFDELLYENNFISVAIPKTLEDLREKFEELADEVSNIDKDRMKTDYEYENYVYSLAEKFNEIMFEMEESLAFASTEPPENEEEYKELMSSMIQPFIIPFVDPCEDGFIFSKICVPLELVYLFADYIIIKNGLPPTPARLLTDLGRDLAELGGDLGGDLDDILKDLGVDLKDPLSFLKIVPEGMFSSNIISLKCYDGFILQAEDGFDNKQCACPGKKHIQYTDLYTLECVDKCFKGSPNSKNVCPMLPKRIKYIPEIKIIGYFPDNKFTFSFGTVLKGSNLKNITSTIKFDIHLSEPYETTANCFIDPDGYNECSFQVPNSNRLNLDGKFITIKEEYVEIKNHLPIIMRKDTSKEKIIGCHTNCQYCYDKSDKQSGDDPGQKCTICFSGFMPKKNTNLDCIKKPDCDDGEYYSIESSRCKKCFFSCKTCEGNGDI